MKKREETEKFKHLNVLNSSKVSEIAKACVNKSKYSVTNESPSIPVKVATVYLLSAFWIQSCWSSFGDAGLVDLTNNEGISFLTLIGSHDLNVDSPGHMRSPC